MKRLAVLLFSVATYAMFLGVFLYAVGFIGNFAVPRSLDSPVRVDIPAALAIDAVLLGLFALQHSVMARGWFKRLVHRCLPAAAERSLYVLASNLALIALFIFWQPIDITIWNVTNPVGRGLIYGLFAAGWLTVLVTTFLINHFDLFGLRQGWLYFRGEPYRQLNFTMPGPYRWVRHPLYVGWLLAFWAAPLMTFGHLVFALGTTAYILIAIRLEERDLLEAHGDSYALYRQQVPMLIPVRKGRRVAPATVD